jgi:prenylcysteine alpha-carboxyl methylesterase
MSGEASPIYRATSTIGFRHSRSFELPPKTSRSVSATPIEGWIHAPYPIIHRGRVGRFIDFLSAVYHEIPVIAPLVASLVKLIGVGYKAYVMLLRLILFSVALSPAFAKLVPWWWTSPSIIRGVQYGPNPRNFLDLYIPDEDVNDFSQKPVVIYVCGGAWIIGYKAWAVPLGAYRAKNGIILVSLDYRNFPQGTLSDMMEDVRKGIQWTIENIVKFGGDPDNITLCGQSAGAHITTMLLLSDYISKSSDLSPPIGNSIRRYIGVSGAYDVVSLAPRLNRRGLYTEMFHSILDNDLFGSSPIHALSFLSNSAIDQLPPISIFHGAGDQTVPFHQAIAFAKRLKEVGLTDVEVEIWPDASHSDPILEGPIGGKHYLGACIASLCVEDGEFEKHGEPLVGDRLLRFARYVMPF